MKRKIENYLHSKDKSEYSNLDRIFELYLTGDIKKLLSKYVGIGIYPTINKSGKTIQLDYSYNNIYIIIDFFEDKYNVVIYPAGISVDELEEFSIDYDYQEDFELCKLIEYIDDKIKNHPKLKDTTLVEKKKKKYSLIARISLCLPIVIFGGMGLYCIITESVIKVNAFWGTFFLIISLTLWVIFDIKSKRIK